MLFHLSLCSKIYHFLSTWITPFSHSFRVGCWWQILLVFLHLRMSKLPLYSWRIFSLGILFRVNSSFLSNPKKYCTTPYGFHGGQEIYCQSNRFPPLGKLSLFFCHFQYFYYFFFSFQKFNFFFTFILFKVHSISCLWPKFEKFSAVFH